MLLLGLTLHCGAGPITPTAETTYRTNGTVILDRNSDSARVAVSFERNDSFPATAGVSLDARPLAFADTTFPVDSVFSLQEDSLTGLLNRRMAVILSDSDLFRDTFFVTVADTFPMTVVLPANRRIRGNGIATLDWSGAAGSEGYILAAVKADRAYTGTGYSAYSLTGATGGTIPSDAFLLEGTPNPDTGLYNLYAYAVTGAPDSSLSADLLPVPMPDQPADNIDERDISGCLGALVVSLVDTVRVVAIP